MMRFFISFTLILFSAPHQTLSSDTGWVGHYKVNHNFPIADEDSYFTVDSNQGYPHIQLVHIADDTVEWRTSGNFEVRDAILIT